MPPLSSRDAFLIQMYLQMWQNINRHIIVVWQSVGAVAGSVALLSLTEKQLLPIDWAIALIVGLSFWMLAHVYDAQAWFDRNISIITKIERHFDAGSLGSPYVAEQRPRKLIGHLSVQRMLGIAVIVVALTFHAVERILPVLGPPLGSFTYTMLLPWLALAAGGCFIFAAHCGWKNTYDKSWAESANANRREPD